jgi:RecJ-like exonuclease
MPLRRRPRRGYLSLVGGTDGISAPATEVVEDDLLEDEVVIYYRPCDKCGTTGKVNGEVCARCSGSGKRATTLSISELAKKVKEQLKK